MGVEARSANRDSDRVRALAGAMSPDRAHGLWSMVARSGHRMRRRSWFDQRQPTTEAEAEVKRRMRLGSPDSTHVGAARRLVDQAWSDLERMPPTCRGGIEIASRALASAERAHGHLDSIEDRSTRAANNETFGLANQAASAAHKTLQFFAGVCEAPGGQARERPLFSRGKIAAEAERAAQAAKRRRR